MSTTNANDTLLRRDCCALVYRPGNFRGSSCSKAATVQHDGRWYCATHSPEAVEKRRAASDARWAARSAEQDKRHAAYADMQRRASEHPTMAARIAELEAALAAVTAQRDQCREAVMQLVSQLEPVAVDAHEIAALEDGHAALLACEEGGQS